MALPLDYRKDRFYELVQLIAPNSPKTQEELLSWKPMWNSLRLPDQEAFERMILSIVNFSPGIEAYPNPVDALLLSIILVQQKAIEILSAALMNAHGV